MVAVGTDDFALTRVPREARYSWRSVAVQRFGQVSALSQFLLGSALGFGMDFWSAFWALTLGAVILEVVAIFLGIMGAREGLQTSLLARWTGFGHGGSALVGLAIGISILGWFGIQSAVSAAGLVSLVGVLPVWAWSLVFGLAVTMIVLWGFGSMQWVAYVTVPAFLILVGWSIVSALTDHDLGTLITQAPPGPELSLLQGTTLVAGGFIGITMGEYVIGLAGVLLAHAAQSADIITIVTSSVGWVGTLVIILGTLKINDWNLYSSGLGIVNFVGAVFGRNVNRAAVTLLVGVVGSLLAAGGILERFTDFLILIGVAFPPIAGIMVAEYFIVRQWRGVLDETRERGTVPDEAPTWVPATLVIWLVAALVGKFVAWGLPSINSLAVALVLYVVAGKAGLVRGVGISRTRDLQASPVPAAAAEPTAGSTTP
jgi:cytosine permease